MDPPGPLVEHRHRLKAYAGKRLREGKADEGPCAPAIPVDVNINVKPEGLCDKSRYDDTPDKDEHNRVFRNIIRLPHVCQPVRFLDVPSPDGEKHAREYRQTKQLHNK